MSVHFCRRSVVERSFVESLSSKRSCSGLQTKLKIVITTQPRMHLEGRLLVVGFRHRMDIISWILTYNELTEPVYITMDIMESWAYSRSIATSANDLSPRSLSSMCDTLHHSIQHPKPATGLRRKQMITGKDSINYLQHNVISQSFWFDNDDLQQYLIIMSHLV